MLKNYFITLARQLWRNRLFTALNIFGLSICICVAWIVFRMVDYEYSYDKRIPDVDNIYQVISKSKAAGHYDEGGFAGVSRPVLNALQNQVTGVELVVPMFYKYQHKARAQGSPQIIAYADKDIQQVSTSPDYFRLLQYHWLAGNISSALDAPDKVVLTDTRASEYFPLLKPQDIIGKTIMYDDTILRRVSAVVAQLNYPNSFSADNNEFIAINNSEIANDAWGGMSSNDLMYIKPEKGAVIADIMKQLNAINLQHNKENFEKYKYENWYDILPLTRKHFETNYGAQTRTADKKVLTGLMIIGAFLLLIACINYINLSTAQLPQRAKEIGIRKTLGSSARGLIWRFVGETFIITTIAALLSFLFTAVAVRVFADFLPVGLWDYMNYSSMILFMLGLIVIVSLLSGLYPAWLSSKISTVNVLKGVTEKVVGRSTFSLRKGLIVFQFLVAQVLIIGSIIIGQQLRYALHKDLGFSKNGIITVEVPYYVWDDPNYKDKQFVLKNELTKHPTIEGVSLGRRPMDNSMNSYLLSYYKDTVENQQQIYVKFGDADYLKLYGFHLLAGRSYNAVDTMHEIVINEKAVETYGFASPQDAVGKVLSQPGEQSHNYPIVGVVADFHQSGIQSEIRPALIASSKNQFYILNIKLPADVSKWKAAIQTTEQEWKKLYAGVPFSYTFYDDIVKKMYDSEEKMQKLVSAATTIAIVISCLGLFGLATLTAFKRTKEVGIRKVLGASVAGIVQLLSKEFLLLVIVSVIIATPVAWWIMNKWLLNFAYRVTIQWWMFVIAAVAACVIALLTVSFQAIKAAVANPVKALRAE